MEKVDNPLACSTILRQKAEELANKIRSNPDQQLSEVEILNLIHEFEVNQIELELQNEELISVEANLRESSQKYLELYDFAPSGYFTISKEGEIKELNLSCANMLGKVRSQFKNSHFGVFVSDDTKPVFNNFLEKVFTAKEKHSCEISLLLNDGQLRYAHLSGVVNPNGNECMVTMLDITESKLVELELREKEFQYSNLANGGMALIWTSGTDKLCNYFNEPWLKFTGRTIEQEMGNGWAEGVHPDDFDKCLKTYITAFDRQESFEMEYRIRHASGEYRWLLDIGNPNYDSNGKFIGYIGYCFDISSRKQEEKKLIESEESYKNISNQLELILDHIPGLVFYKDKKNNFIRVNRYFAQAQKAEKKALEGKSLYDLYPKDDAEKYYQDDLSVIKSGIAKLNIEEHWETKEGIKWVNTSKIPFVDSNGDTIGIIGISMDITERKVAEKTVIESEKRYRYLFDNMLNGFAHCQMLYDSKGNPEDYIHINVNKAFLAQTGLTNVVGKKISEIIPGIRQADDELFNIYGRVATNGVPEHFEMFIASLNNWFSISVYSPLKDQFVVIFDNITERKNAEKALHESEKKYRLIAENTADVIWCMDMNLKMTFISLSVFKLRGYTVDEVMLQSVNQFLTPDSLEKMQRLFEEQTLQIKNNPLRETNSILVEFEQIKKDGSIIMTENTITLIYDDDEKNVGILGITKDITKRKQAEILLRESEEQFRAVAQSANDAIITIDNNGIVLGWNRGAEKIFGYSEAEITGKDLNLIMPLKYIDSHKKGIKRIDEGGERHVIGKTSELLGINKKGNEFPIELSLSEWETSSGKFITGIIRDITERKKADQEIKLKNQELQKINAEKDKFFSIISHDLRSPFNGFLGLSQLIAEKLPNLTMDEIQDIAESMRKSAVNLFRLLENLLQWARVQQGTIPFNPEITKLLPLVNDCIAMMIEPAKQKGIEINLDIPNELEVFADINMLQTIIRNLVSNAVKFTPKSGKVFINAQTIKNKDTEITIKDSGIGMSSEMVDSLFNIDVQTNRVGTDGEPSTGLGLILCKEFIEKHGGRIMVDSKEGNPTDKTRGSIFNFTIPYNKITDENGEINYSESVEAKNPINNLKILIAEDDEISEKLIARVVKPFCKEILIANNGVQAVEACRNNPDIDLVLMDIKMPELDGYEATIQIRQFNKDLLIVAQTAYALNSARELAFEAGCNDYISKPISHKMVGDLMKKHFTKKL